MPTIDLADVSAELAVSNGQKRQFEPQYAQNNYEVMLKNERVIGDYTSDPLNRMKIKNSKREQMILLIEKLHNIK